MGRHPYHRLRIIYAKQKNWDNAIKICHKFINAVKSGNKQFLHPGFKITVRKYEEWIRKYEARAMNEGRTKDKRSLYVGHTKDMRSFGW